MKTELTWRDFFAAHGIPLEKIVMPKRERQVVPCSFLPFDPYLHVEKHSDEREKEWSAMEILYGIFDYVQDYIAENGWGEYAPNEVQVYLKNECTWRAGYIYVDKA